MLKIKLEISTDHNSKNFVKVLNKKELDEVSHTSRKLALNGAIDELKFEYLKCLEEANRV
jgi:hypothetical protein